MENDRPNRPMSPGHFQADLQGRMTRIELRLDKVFELLIPVAAHVAQIAPPETELSPEERREQHRVAIINKARQWANLADGIDVAREVLLSEIGDDEELLALALAALKQPAPWPEHITPPKVDAEPMAVETGRTVDELRVALSAARAGLPPPANSSSPSSGSAAAPTSGAISD